MFNSTSSQQLHDPKKKRSVWSKIRESDLVIPILKLIIRNTRSFLKDQTMLRTSSMLNHLNQCIIGSCAVQVIRSHEQNHFIFQAASKRLACIIALEWKTILWAPISRTVPFVQFHQGFFSNFCAQTLMEKEKRKERNKERKKEIKKRLCLFCRFPSLVKVVSACCRSLGFYL